MAAQDDTKEGALTKLRQELQRLLDKPLAKGDAWWVTLEMFFGGILTHNVSGISWTIDGSSRRRNILLWRLGRIVGGR